MNHLPWVLLAAAVAGCQNPAGTGTAHAPEARSRRIPAGQLPGPFQLANAPVLLALDIYRALAAKELVIAPEVQQSRALINATARGNLSKAEAQQLLEKALREQAGVTITSLDEERLSVTLAGP